MELGGPSAMRWQTVVACLAAASVVGCASAEMDIAADFATTSTVPTTSTIVTTTTTTVPPTTTTTAPPAVTEQTVDPPQGLFEGARQSEWENLDLTDLNAMSAFFTEDAMWDGMPIDSAPYMSVMAYFLAMGWIESAEDCVHRSAGFAECSASFTTDLHRPAGLEFLVTRQVWLDDERLISAVTTSFLLSGLDEFESAFHDWLLVEYPDIAASPYQRGDSERTPEAILNAVEVVDEFIAASDEYPIGGPVSVPEPVLSAIVRGVEVFNAEERQVALVDWALGRFDEAGLPEPPVTAVRFPPTMACASGDFNGLVIHDGSEGQVELCADQSLFMLDEGLPITTRRTILHELGHLWVLGHTDQATRDAFMDERGVPGWSGGPWEDNGSEHAAEIIMWGLMDDEVLPRVPPNTPDALADDYTVLTGEVPPG